jgi:fido (protein-threonine AMPylation protein)
MATEKALFRSTVAGLIDFKPEENPSWRKYIDPAISTWGMIEEIVKIRQTWDSIKENSRDGFVDGIKRRLEAKFFYHCNVEEEHGLQSVDEIEKLLETTEDAVSKGNESLSFEEQETVNLRDAYLYLKSESESVDMEYRGLLEESMLRQVNKIILRNIPRQKFYTKAGTYSNNPRITQFRGETYYYQQPDDMQEAVCLLMDRYNSLFTQSMNKTDEVEKLQGIFKSVAWLVFELLDLHPFSDGNGRLCRLLCSYVLSTCTPFPSPIYNMHSDSSQKDFIDALVNATRSESRHPCELTTMIIESNWASWQNLKKELSCESHGIILDKSLQDSQPNCIADSPKSHDITTDVSHEDLQSSLERSQSCKSSRENGAAHHLLIPSCA